MRRHPVTDEPFNYNQTCATCVHFTDKQRTVRGTKYRTTRCALDPQQRNLADIKGTVWSAMPACSQHQTKLAS